MFDIGFWELAILFGLGLVVLGPERLPRVANQMGNWMGQARRMARQLTTQLRSELDLNSINNPPPPSYRTPSTPPASSGPDHGVDTGPTEDPDSPTYAAGPDPEPDPTPTSAPGATAETVADETDGPEEKADTTKAS